MEEYYHRLADELADEPFLHRMGNGRYLNHLDNQMLTAQEVVRRFGTTTTTRSRMGYNMLKELFQDEDNSWLLEYMSSPKVRFVGTQRLTSNSDLGVSRSANRPMHDTYEVTSAVARCSEDIRNQVRTMQAKYASLSQSLDRSFPTRLLELKDVPTVSQTELTDRLNKLEKRQESLQEIGLLSESENRVTLPPTINFTDTNLPVLSIYIDDTNKKLDVFTKISDKITLLKEIIEDRFLNKALTINQKQGFVFTGIDGIMLLPSQLSSGEQHELVLLYELLFEFLPMHSLLSMNRRSRYISHGRSDTWLIYKRLLLSQVWKY